MSQNANIERSFEGAFDAWCALWCNPGSEIEVARAIEALGHSTLVLRRRPLKFRKLGSPRPALPRYVLARVAMLGPADWDKVCAIDGVRGLLWAGGHVARIPESQIEVMRALQDQRAHIELSWWLANQGRLTTRMTPQYRRVAKTKSARRRWRRRQEREREELARRLAG